MILLIGINITEACRIKITSPFHNQWLNCGGHRGRCYTNCPQDNLLFIHAFSRLKEARGHPSTHWAERHSEISAAFKTKMHLCEAALLYLDDIWCHVTLYYESNKICDKSRTFKAIKRSCLLICSIATDKRKQRLYTSLHKSWCSKWFICDLLAEIWDLSSWKHQIQETHYYSPVVPNNS